MKNYSLNINNVKFLDLNKTDLRKTIIVQNKLELDYFEKTVGNHLFIQGSDSVQDIARNIYKGKKVTFNEDQKVEIENSINRSLEPMVALVKRSIITAIKEVKSKDKEDETNKNSK